jgi:hypothetical protein
MMSSFNLLQAELEPESEFKTRDIESVIGVNDPDVRHTKEKQMCLKDIHFKT